MSIFKESKWENAGNMEEICKIFSETKEKSIKKAKMKNKKKFNLESTKTKLDNIINLTKIQIQNKKGKSDRASLIETGKSENSPVYSEKKRKRKRKKKTISEEHPIKKTIVKAKEIKKSLKRKFKPADKELILTDSEPTVSKKKKPVTLRQKMLDKLKAARFRYLNEQIYTTTSKDAQKLFKTDPEAFKVYHEGFEQQVKKWPINPIDVIIKTIKKLPKNLVVADFGCGNAKLAKSVQQKVHSFDLVSSEECVVACDMANVPLDSNSVDVAVFCLSLMGTNLNDYLKEANRVLKMGGTLKIAEVETRFDDVDSFVANLQKFGFKKTWMDLSHNLFYFMDFKKENHLANKKKLPLVSLQPCLYKKR